MADVRVSEGATLEETEAIIVAIETILQRQSVRRPTVVIERSKWAAAARREALDDRV